jgi:hypothetical protein
MARVSKLPDLKGVWRIKRRVISPSARFIGNASIFEDGGVLRYAERGTLIQNGISTEAYRDYIYAVDGDCLSIKHPDGKAFLDLQFVNGTARARHVCGADTYDAYYKFKNPDCLMIAYSVVGPRKGYRIFSRLSR